MLRLAMIWDGVGAGTFGGADRDVSEIGDPERKRFNARAPLDPRPGECTRGAETRFASGQGQEDTAEEENPNSHTQRWPVPHIGP